MEGEDDPGYGGDGDGSGAVGDDLIRVLARSAEALMEAIIRLRHLESGVRQGFLAEILTCTAVAPEAVLTLRTNGLTPVHHTGS